jgi:membrane fusion protein, heavy metal efflux system
MSASLDERSGSEPRPSSTPMPASRSFLFSWRGVTLGVILGGIAAAGLVWEGSDRPPATLEQPVLAGGLVSFSDEQLRQIVVASVERREVDLSWEAPGKVTFHEERTTPVFSPFSGRVLEVLASRGAFVRAGQALVAVESPDIVETLGELAGARADLSRAQINQARASISAERAERLHEREAIATKELQQAEAELALTEEEISRAEMALASVKQRLELFGINVELAGNAKGNLSRRVVIHAPIDGTVVERKVGVGQYLQPDASEPLFFLSDLSQVWVVADVYESDIARVRAGAAVKVRVASYPDRVFSARVSLVNPVVDSELRTVRVVCTLDNPEGILRPDMFVRMTFGAGRERVVTVVPAGAVVAERSQTVVFVEQTQGQFRRQVVQVGEAVNGYVAIESGLKAGDRVAVAGALLLAELFR